MRHLYYLPAYRRGKSQAVILGAIAAEHSGKRALIVTGDQQQMIERIQAEEPTCLVSLVDDCGVRIHLRK